MKITNVKKNYYIMDGKMAYKIQTHIRVHNIRVYKIPIAVKDEEVLEYFAQFGEVKKVQLITCDKHKQKPSKMGSVHFADAVVAAKVLQKKHHTLRSQRILLDACDSWHQHDAYKYPFNRDNGEFRLPAVNTYASESDQNSFNCGYNLGATSGVTASQPNALNILELNDDCLEIIAKKLNLYDQMNMARTCTRFSGIVQICSKVEHKNLRLEDLANMTLLEIHEVFLMIGSSVETIMGVIPYINRSRLIKLISMECPNLKHVILNTGQTITSSLRMLFANLQNITNIQFRNCSLDDKDVRFMQQLPKLEILTLADNSGILGKYLSPLKTLRHLDIHGCCSIRLPWFILIVKSLTELQTLNIIRCQHLRGMALETVERYCTKLEVLRMSCVDIPYDSVARIPALKRLELIAQGAPARQSLFPALSMYKSSQLEYLMVTSRDCVDLESAMHISQLIKLKHLILAHNEDLNDACLNQFCKLGDLEEIVMRDCTSITNAGLLNLVLRCTKLRRINVQHCTSINDQFVFDVIELLRQRQQCLPPNRTQPDPVVFYVFKTGIKDLVMTNPKCQNSSSLIKLSFSFEAHYKVYISKEESGLDMSDYLDGVNLDRNNDVIL